MPEQRTFFEVVEEICERDGRFKPDSYEFVLQAVEFTQKSLGKDGHVSGAQLLEGMRQFALKQFGPLAKTVLQHWGITTTADFGTIVFIMIEHGLLSKTEDDNPKDFENVYEFDAAFRHTISDISPLS